MNIAGDAHEQQADRAAAKVMRMPDRPDAHACSCGGTCPRCLAKPALGLARLPAGGPAAAAAPPLVHEVLASPGEPLDGTSRAFMERRFRQPFNRVRVHTDAKAARSAESINARAYARGQDIVFGAGEFRPGTAAGGLLLAHELAHTVQAGDDRAAAAPIRRQPKEDDKPPRFGVAADPALMATLPIPGTGLSATLGPIAPASLLGAKLPLPTTLVLTNLAGGGTAPSFIARLSAQGFIGMLLQRIDLSTSLRDGVPPQGIGADDAVKRISLVNPVVRIDAKTGNLSGFATLSVGSDYPPWVKGPTELDVRITSTQLGRVDGDVSYAGGLLSAHFEVTLNYDTPALESALKPAIAPPGGFAAAWQRLKSVLIATVPGIDLGSLPKGFETFVQKALAGQVKGASFAARVIEELGRSIPPGADLASLRQALSQFADELSRAGYKARGTVRLGPVPISTISAESTGGKTPTTSFAAAGVIVVPPGSVSSVAAPALGATYQKTTPKGSLSATVAALPGLDTEAISRHGSFAEQFPVHSYGEVAYMRNAGKEVKLGVRFTLNVSSAELVKRADAPKAGLETTAAPATPNVSLSFVGSF